MGSVCAKYEFRPIILKRLMHSTGIIHSDLTPGLEFGHTTFYNVVNRAGYIPGPPAKAQQFKQAIESSLKKNKHAMTWLKNEGLKIDAIWQADQSPPLPREKSPTRRKHLSAVPGIGSQKQENCQLTIDWEVSMLTPEAKKAFKLFKDPFIDDIQSESDIYMSDEHRYIEAAMLDAARHSGFLAVVGDVGSGKTIIRKKVFSQLKRDNNVIIISPRVTDKSRITATTICEAVIRDISDETPRNNLEDRTRQVIRLLTERANSSQRHCLFIEEAHDLNTSTLKYLKRFYELEEFEDGFRRLLGIIMVGQLEMKRKLDERTNFDAREVIRRCQIVELGPLNGVGEMEAYLALKFKRAGIDINTIFDVNAYQAIRNRLTVVNGQSKISHCFPLLINNYTAKALNLAAKLGQKKITAEIVYEV